MRAMKLVVPAVILAAGFVVCTSATYGKQEYAKKEGKKCVDCHAKVEGKDAMNKNLTDMGKYYKDHDHSLDGYKK
ncbi:MAG: hypothetical protein LAP87_30655 [Acidobacteriia bacterium]|nr:hypothetical protein [Terriglobia bacterium]